MGRVLVHQHQAIPVFHEHIQPAQHPQNFELQTRIPARFRHLFTPRVGCRSRSFHPGLNRCRRLRLGYRKLP